MKQYPSIFNDVIGPVMIGPSSSHTAASVRIGRMVRQLAGEQPLQKIRFCFDPQGSLAATYHSQGVDIGLLAGFMGYDTWSPEIRDALALADQAGVPYEFCLEPLASSHPNAYDIQVLRQNGSCLRMTALSVGGGMVELVECMDFPVSATGGFYETFLLCEEEHSEEIQLLLEGFGRDDEQVDGGAPYETTYQIQEGKLFVHLRSEKPLHLPTLPDYILEMAQMAPVLPIPSQRKPQVPFCSEEELLAYGREHGCALWEMGVLYEAQRSGYSREEIWNRMLEQVHVLKDSLEHATGYVDPERMLPDQSMLLNQTNLLGGEGMNRIVQYVTRFMEIKSQMGVFVAAPTAGSCGCLAGTLFALASSEEEIAKGFFAGGMIGVLIAWDSTFAAELGGCQAECGAGSGMCAAACVHLLGGTLEQSLAAASMSLQNVLGMVCDPVANRVEVPCLGRNIMCALNAVANANMAVAGFLPVIPLGETIQAMDQVGRAIAPELRCTGQAGLSVTPTSKKLQEASGFRIS